MSNPLLGTAHTIWSWYLYLLSPPADSWVARTASTFWVFALMIFLPMAFITGLDIASWVIMRTLGTISADLPPSVIVRNVVSESSSAETSPTDAKHPTVKRSNSSRSNFSLNLTITPAQPGTVDPSTSSADFTGVHAHGHSVNHALAGEGIFSPIPSRATSPELSTARRRSRAPSNATTASAAPHELSSSSSSFVDLAESPLNAVQNQDTDGLRRRAPQGERS